MSIPDLDQPITTATDDLLVVKVTTVNSCQSKSNNTKYLNRYEPKRISRTASLIINLKLINVKYTDVEVKLESFKLSQIHQSDYFTFINFKLLINLVFHLPSSDVVVQCLQKTITLFILQQPDSSSQNNNRFRVRR